MLPEDMSRQVLNSHIGVMNMISRDDLRGVMMDTFKQVRELLTDHCGPYGKFAVIVDPTNPTAEPVFTKDGINIIRSLEYMSPMQDLVRRMVAYIGGKIESAAGDGTTSSMIMVVSALEYLTNILSTSSYKYTYQQLVDIMDLFIERTEEQYSLHVITPDKFAQYHNVDKQVAIRTIAYRQAMSSSHGDTVLSNAVADMFSIIPEDSWDLVCFMRESYETNKRIETVIEDDQYVLDCNVFHPHMLNKEMGTECIFDDAELLVLCTDLMNSEAFIYPKVKQYLEKKTPIASNGSNGSETKYVPSVLIIPNGVNLDTKLELEKLMKDNVDKDIFIFVHTVDNPRMNDLVALSLVNGFRPFVGNTFNELNISKGVSGRYRNGQLKLNGLYVPNGDSIYHPLIGSKTFRDMDLAIDSIKQVVSKMKQDTLTKSLSKDITYFERLHNKIKLTRRAIVKIGGSSHDNAAAVDVVMDTVSSVRIALTKGFVFGAEKTLQKVLKEAVLINNKYDTSHIQYLIEELKKAFLKGIDCVHESIMKHAQTHAGVLDVSFDDPEYGDQHYFFDPIFKDTFLDITKNITVQASTIDISVLKRFKEVALKFICADRILTAFSVYINKKTGETNDN